MMRTENAIANPSMMMRASIRDLGLSYVGPPAEDYLLWLRLLARGVRFANIPEDLVAYRVHSQGIYGGLAADRALAIRLNALVCHQLELDEGPQEAGVLSAIMAHEGFCVDVPHSRREELLRIWKYRPDPAEHRFGWRRARRVIARTLDRLSA
jgi:hypothetical protein